VLRKLLESPECVDWFGGNLAQQAERSLIEAAARDNLSFKEALIRKMVLLRAEGARGSKTEPGDSRGAENPIKTQAKQVRRKGSRAGRDGPWRRR
jgi:hypothetical protein